MASSNGTGPTNSIDRTYAAALFQMADAAGQLDEITDEVEQLAELLKANHDLSNIIHCRSLSTSELAGIVERVFKDKVSQTLYRFIQVVNAKGRLAVLGGILHAYSDLLDESRGIVEVDLYVAECLDDAEAARVAESLSGALGKQVAIHQYIDPDLIGGMKVRIGDELIDGSVATKLNQLKKTLIEQGREKARAMSQ